IVAPEKPTLPGEAREHVVAIFDFDAAPVAKAADRVLDRPEIRRLHGHAKPVIAGAIERLVAIHACAGRLAVFAVPPRRAPRAPPLGVGQHASGLVAVYGAAGVRVEHGGVGSGRLAVPGYGLTGGVGERLAVGVDIHVGAQIRAGREELDEGGENGCESHSQTLACACCANSAWNLSGTAMRVAALPRADDRDQVPRRVGGRPGPRPQAAGVDDPHGALDQVVAVRPHGVKADALAQRDAVVDDRLFIAARAQALAAVD